MDISELKRLDPTKPFRRHPWEMARASFVISLYKKYIGHVKILADIGSGDAFVMNEFVKAKLADEYFGVDTAYNNETLSLVKPKVDPSIKLINDLAELKQYGLHADACLLMDVLEHCEDDIAVLRSVLGNNITQPTASILVTVPAFQSMFSGHDKLLGHYRRYTRKQIINVCRTAGLEIVQSGYFFHSLLMPRFMQRLFEKAGWRKADHSLDSWQGNKLTTRLFYSILRADFRAGRFLSKLGIQFPGLSCYCICRKLPS